MSESRIQNTKRNFKTSLILQVVKTALVLLNRIIFVRILGATFLGINGLFTNILTVLSIADLGMVPAMMYSLYKPLAEKNERLVRAYVQAFKKVYNIIAIVILLLGLMLIPFLHYIVNLPSDVPNLYLYYILMLLNVALSYMFVYKITLLQADQKSYIINKIDTFAQIGLFILQVVVLFITKNFALYLLSNIIITLVSNLIKSLAANREHKYLQDDNEQLPKNLRKDLSSNIKSLFLYKIGGVIQSNTDNILISIFVGTIAVGYYSNYSMIILTITSFITMVFTSIKASLGNYNVQKTKEEQSKMFFVLEDYNFLLISFCATCFMLLTPDFIKLAFGIEYLLEPIALIFIVANFYTSNIRQNLWMYRETTGVFEKVKYVTLVTAIINIIASVIGGYLFGITGIVAATVFSRMIYAWWMEPIVLFKNYFNTSAKKYFTAYIARGIYTCAVIVVLSFVLSYIRMPNLYIEFIVKAVIAATFSLVLLALPLLKNDSFKYLKIAKRKK